MSEIKVKAYGFIQLTEKQYVTIQTIGMILIAIGFMFSLFADLSDAESVWLRYLTEIILAVFVLELIESYYIMKLFKKKKLELASTDQN
ncbi:MAG: hypothetical protein OEY19_10265 [Gammaproteobacteria bacterium]|nr:hypothetical protein [Gammaproteobacteria bacterium]MDH5631147.1 hypothetical protein [Gammaproteobacteria bacterium]